MIVTGLTKLKLGDTFAGYPNVTLATSDGLVYSWGANVLRSNHSATNEENTSMDGDRVWEYRDFGIDWDAATNIALPIITKFTFRTNGTCQTPRFPGIGWSYFGSDPEWGRRQATQLTVSIYIELSASVHRNLFSSKWWYSVTTTIFCVS